MLMLAAGGECCGGIEGLRSQDDLFGAVASDSHHQPHVPPGPSPALAGLWEAMAETRSQCGDELAPPPGYFDIDASLVQIHSENKEDSAPTYKVGFGFHPMLCFADATGEALGAVAPGQCRAVDRHGIP